MKLKKLLSILLCMLLSIGTLTVAAAVSSASIPGVEIPEGATLVFNEDCADSSGWTFSGSAKVVNGAYNFNGGAIQVYGQGGSATFNLPESAYVRKNMIITSKDNDFINLSTPSLFYRRACRISRRKGNLHVKTARKCVYV